MKKPYMRVVYKHDFSRVEREIISAALRLDHLANIEDLREFIRVAIDNRMTWVLDECTSNNEGDDE